MNLVSITTTDVCSVKRPERESMKTFNYSKRVKEALNYWEQQKINGDATAQTKIDEILSINPVKPFKR